MFGGTWAFAGSVVVLAQSTSSLRIIRDFSARLRGFLMIIMQQLAQPFATLQRPASSRLRVTRKQQEVVLPLMISLRMVMRDIFAQRQPQGALTDEKHLGRALFLYRPHPALRIGIQVQAAHRQRKRMLMRFCYAQISLGVVRSSSPCAWQPIASH
jgi:hypothetical protein